MEAVSGRLALPEFLARLGNPLPSECVDDRELEIAAAYRKGLEEGETEALAASNKILAESIARHRSEIEAARKAWVEGEADCLERLVLQSLAAIRGEICDAVARILSPVVGRHLTEQAIARLLAEIRKLTSDEGGIKLKISGPSDLVQELVSRLDDAVIVETVIADTCEVAVSIDKTVIELSLGRWLMSIGVHEYGATQEERAGTRGHSGSQEAVPE
ncbi:hypothetical protein Rvan_2570 [Rhodomicrobium vannielii ATCC 17100]|uniref:Uncharacterized protein n=1 Tax=Rhodomicrobium vannielii (strain ATCC 17100 / DSM 162 / LMG 4299 / NCIMB 10020 / ATH 3.1.1) TaxID=648757 RepID=E3I6R7_RHOVT|nr:hypothetical protein [Rhodomicrobium vannielii]ADP71785.1 hypothetical protein Rvan_2570 [Rhodomicrobium vannielii ATCC 17100]